MANTNTNEVLTDITNNLVGQFNLSELLTKVVNLVMRLLNAEVCSIFLDDKDVRPDIIVMLAGSGFAEPLVNKAEYETGEGLTGYIYKTGKKFNIKSPAEFKDLIDGETDKPIWAGKQDTVQWPTGQNEFRNLIALPLNIKQEIIGVIKVENKRLEFGHHFGAEDEIVFEIIANVVALAIENARLYQKIEKQLKAISAKAAHRINNQVTNYDAIDLDLEFELSQDICNKEKIGQIRERVRNTTSNLKMMISEFRNYGKPIELQRKHTSFVKIIEDEIWLANQKYTEINFVKELDQSLPDLFIDGARLAESIKELITNSIKAILKKSNNVGCIKLTAKMNSSKDVLFKIEDNGPGFPTSLQVFEPFNSTDTQSTGLGLATVKELVERHGGQIWASNSNLGGACVEFNIPIQR